MFGNILAGVVHCTITELCVPNSSLLVSTRGRLDVDCCPAGGLGAGGSILFTNHCDPSLIPPLCKTFHRAQVGSGLFGGYLHPAQEVQYHWRFSELARS